MAMTDKVIDKQPLPAEPRIVPPPHRKWTSDLCGCCSSFDVCCYSVFCYCCLLREVAESLDENCCVPCLPMCGLMSMRTKLRTQFGIEGSVCQDFCQLCCCNGCGACQMHRELVHLGILRQEGCCSWCETTSGRSY